MPLAEDYKELMMSPYKMNLTAEETSILNGSQGESMAKIMKTLVMYGDTFNADRLVPVTGKGGHLVTSFGLSVMKPVYKMLDDLIKEGAISKQPFSVDPRPIDHRNVPSSILQKLIFSIMYGKQSYYEKQLKKLGIMSDKAYTCTCYLNEIGNIPQKGEVLSWAESSAVVYANSVLGARCNRNSGVIELFGSILSKVPNFGFLTDEGRKASWIIEIKTSKLPESQILGSAIGMKVMEDVPYIKGLSTFLGNDLNDDIKAYLKDMGAATASNGAVGLYHVDKLTPEAVEQKESLIKKDAQVYTIDDAELLRVKNSYPCIWKNPSAKPKMCFIGCPHLTVGQLKKWTADIEKSLKANGKKKLAVTTILTAAPDVLEAFAKLPEAKRLKATGARTSYICPLMYMNNPKCRTMPVITNSNKLRTYTTSRYHTDEEILALITKGGK